MTPRLRLLDLFEQLRPGQLELLIGAKLRHQIVIVGIEPLGHLLSLAATAAAVGHATGHGEQRVQRRLAVGRAEALRHHAEHQRVRKNLVVPGEVAHRQQLDTGIGLGLPVLCSQLATNLAQPLLVQLALPICLQGFLQLAVRTDAWKSEVVRYSHFSLQMSFCMNALIVRAMSA